METWIAGRREWLAFLLAGFLFLAFCLNPSPNSFLSLPLEEIYWAWPVMKAWGKHTLWSGAWCNAPCYFVAVWRGHSCKPRAKQLGKLNTVPRFPGPEISRVRGLHTLLTWLPVAWRSVPAGTVCMHPSTVPAYTLLSSLSHTDPQQSFLALAPTSSLISSLSLPYRLRKRKELMFLAVRVD